DRHRREPGGIAARPVTGLGHPFGGDDAGLVGGKHSATRMNQRSRRNVMPMFRLAGGLSPSSYQRAWLPKDVIAGIVLSTLLVPQGMAYAELAGLPPVTGLYPSILCLLGYAVFGPSRILVLGPDSSLGPMIAATILPLAGANGDP